MAKQDRLAFRASPEDKDLIQQAAELNNMTITDFVIQAARSKATEVLEAANTVQLKQAAWESFCNELDRPAKVIPELEAFMNEPSVFE